MDEKNTVMNEDVLEMANGGYVGPTEYYNKYVDEWGKKHYCMYEPWIQDSFMSKLRCTYAIPHK